VKSPDSEEGYVQVAGTNVCLKLECYDVNRVSALFFLSINGVPNTIFRYKKVELPRMPRPRASHDETLLHC
jgi:hypothetical protein